MRKKVMIWTLILAVFIMLVGKNDIFFKEAESTDIFSKVSFEGIGEITSESLSEIAEQFNASEFSYPEIVIELDNSYDQSIERYDEENLTLEEAQKLLKEQRDNVKEYYVRTNKAIMEAMDLSAFDLSFEADSYAPFIVAKYDHEITAQNLEDIYALAEDESIKKIYVRTNKQEKAEISSAINAIDADNITISNLYANGDGIVIGILENGIVNVNNAYLDDYSVTTYDGWSLGSSNHATQVAICALSIAPGASILSSSLFGWPSDEVEWMLDNGVNIINMSYGYDTEYTWGTYTSESAYFDHIVRHNWVTFTCSAGNKGETEEHLVTPPNGYNTITVGECNDNGIRSSTSSYEEKFDINFPNLVAPGFELNIPTFYGDTYSGTSYAAPFVAGCAAVLMQDTPSFVLYPEHVMSVLMASSQQIDQYETPTGIGFDDEIGAGMLNLTNALVAADNRTAFTVREDKFNQTVSTKQVYLDVGDKIRIAFVSLVNAGEYPDTTIVTRYELKLYTPSGVLLRRSNLTHNNQFVDYQAVTSGYYTIKIAQIGYKQTDIADMCSYAFVVE